MGHCHTTWVCSLSKSLQGAVGLSLCHAVVIDIAENLPKGSHYHLYFDNYFTNFGFLKALRNRGKSNRHCSNQWHGEVSGSPDRTGRFTESQNVRLLHWISLAADTDHF
ncbi:hypothetical protein PoB_002540100 [Plakobranchus ocellatus]|uniref:PiggyBac transposable element-derived protein domain-containing protein n=1 Tax=Plakobranchus ocellatus TaxID=259542 RepID=A0AAV3ZSC2_9GAST|nr:hypothetical protein PoB_002540100 [Plakobranchus ocellatus]